MKKFWKYSAIVFLLLCFFAPSGIGAATSVASTVLQAAGPVGMLAGTALSASCSGVGSCIYAFGAWITSLIITIMSWLLWLAGFGLDWVLNYTVTQMSQNISGMTGINIIWKTIRDLSNIAFIFILLYEAIKLILSRSDTAKIKGVIAGIIITALLINFSMFFTKVIIDASNVVTVGFYQSILGATGANGQSSTVGTSITGTTMTTQKGLSGAFINQLNIVNYYAAQQTQNMNMTGSQDNKSVLMINLGGSVLFLVLAFVFFAVAIMFLIRYITFVVLLMSAPLGYLGFGLPMLKSTQSTWWNTLIGQCIFAPLWMFCAWAILMLVGSPGFLTLTGGATLKSLAANGAFTDLMAGKAGAAAPDGIALIINFALIIFLVIGSLTLAKKYAGQGSGYVSQATGKLTAFAGGAVMGGAAMAGRNSVGRAANALANNEGLKNAAANNVFARGLLKASNRTANSTFDARNTKAVGQTTGALGMNIGKGTKDTLRTVQKAKAEKEAKFAETLKPNEKQTEDAKKDAADLRKGIKEKEDKLNSKEFKEGEAKEWKEHLESETYKNSDVFKNAEKEHAENEAKLKPEIDKEAKLNEELKNLEKQKAETFSLLKQKEIDEQIKSKGVEIGEQKKAVEDIQKELAKNDTAEKARQKYENEWKSQGRIETEGEIEGLRGAAEESEKIANLYATRVEAYAKNLEDGQHHIAKYAAAIGVGAVGAAIGSPILATAGAGYLGYRLYTHATNWKGDRQVAADKVRKLAKQKTNKEKLTEAAAAVEKERLEEEKKGGGTPETPPPAAPTPTPPAPTK